MKTNNYICVVIVAAIQDRRLKPLKVNARLQTCVEIRGIFYYMDRYTFSELINMKPDVRIEHPIGEIVKIQFSECKVVESDDYCDGCIFEDDLSVCVNINCCARHRKDGKHVIYQEQ